MGVHFYSYPPVALTASGLATEAKQDDIISDLDDLNDKDFATETTLAQASSTLGSIEGKDFATEATLTGAASDLASLAGKDFATSAKQDTQNASLSSIDTKVATAAKQDTGNTSLSTIAGKDFATSAKQDAEATLVGAVTETAPASDTASSGLNGRLQRIAQRLTSMIAQLPATLGQKVMASSMAVTIASDQSSIPITNSSLTTIATNSGQSPQNANVTDSTNAAVGTSAMTESAPSDAVGFLLSAAPANTGVVYYRLGGTATTSAGHPLEASRDTGYIPVKANLSIISDTASQKYNLTWVRR